MSHQLLGAIVSKEAFIQKKEVSTYLVEFPPTGIIIALLMPDQG